MGVWVGNADYTPMQQRGRLVGAAPIWHEVMVAARGDRGHVVRRADRHPAFCGVADSGTLPSEACPQQREGLFAARQGPLPAGYDLWQRVRIDRVTGQLATEFTPTDRVETRMWMIFPEKYRGMGATHATRC